MYKQIDKREKRSDENIDDGYVRKCGVNDCDVMFNDEKEDLRGLLCGFDRNGVKCNERDEKNVFVYGNEENVELYKFNDIIWYNNTFTHGINNNDDYNNYNKNNTYNDINTCNTSTYNNINTCNDNEIINKKF